MLLALVLFASGPLDEIQAARANYDALPKDRQATTLYVSMLGTSERDRPDLECAFDLTLNGLTFRRRPIHLTPVAGKSKTLYALDTSELEWKAEAVANLLRKEPYFYTIDPHIPLMRADWFVREGSFGQTYYDLLGFGKTVNDLDKRVGLDRKSSENLRALHGARVVESGVALNPRAVARFGSTLGAYWQTFDQSDATQGNPFENLDDLTFKKFAATEIFGNLPNGLFWWALANGEGQLQNAAPTNIAADRRTYTPHDRLTDVTKERPSYRVVEVQNAHSCLGCHAQGLRSAPDYVSSTIVGGKLNILSKDKVKAGRIEDFFDARAQAEAMVSDSLGFTRAVERITGRKSLDACNTFAAVRWQYAEAPVPIEQAARELNVDVPAFDAAARAGDDQRLALAYWFLGKGDHRNAKAVLGLVDDAAYKAFLGGQTVPLGSNTLRALVSGTAVPRDLWESVAYHEAALMICYGTGERRAATLQMVRDKFGGVEAKPEPPAPPLEVKQPPKVVEPTSKPKVDPDQPPPASVYENAKPGDVLPVTKNDGKVARDSNGNVRTMRRKAPGDWRNADGWELQ